MGLRWAQWGELFFPGMDEKSGRRNHGTVDRREEEASLASVHQKVRGRPRFFVGVGVRVRTKTGKCFSQPSFVLQP